MSNSIPENIGESIIAHSDAIELGADIAEFTIDQLLDDGIFKDIPWIGWIFKAKSVYTSLSDRILLAKIVKFLISLRSNMGSPRSEILAQLEKSSDERRRIGDHLLIALDRLNDLDKPELVAKCFSFYLDGLLSFQEFSQLIDAITKCHQSDLAWFYKPFPRINLRPPYERLFAAGLSHLSSKQRVPAQRELGPLTEISLKYQMSTLGRLLQDVITGRLPKRPDADSRRRTNIGTQKR